MVMAASCNCGTRDAAHRVESIRGPRPSDPAARVVLPGGPWNERSPLGTNLSGFYDWSSELPVVDLFKTSREWISGTPNAWDDGRPVDVDEHGWVKSVAPGQIVRTLMLWETRRYRAGKYIVLYDGEGDISYSQDAAARLIEAESRPGRHVLDIDPSRSENGILMHITRVDPQNYVRNIRVLMTGGSCEADPTEWCDESSPCASGRCVPFEESYEEQPFNPDFLARTRRFSVIRLLDWFAANDSEVASWDDRPKLDDARWTRDGAPAELMIALCNALHAEPWVTVPHLADDDYNRRLATLFRDRLDPTLRVWAEYSNEVWNDIFAQASWATQRGEAAGLGDGGFHARLLFYAQRAAEVVEIWRGVLGRDRSVRVLASQAGNAWTSEVILEASGEHADVLAIAPYFGITAVPDDEHGAVRRMNVSQLIAHTRQELLPKALEMVRENFEVAQRHRLSLVAYEGGQHFVGAHGLENDERLNQLFDEINRDPAMAEIYRAYLDGWKERGGALFVHFVNCDRWSKWGRWGALEYIEQPTDESPKYRALMGFIDETPRWW
jgi:hypothetical protein